MEQNYTVGDGISRWYTGVTSKNFLLKLILWGSGLYLILFLIFGKGFLSGFIEYIQVIVSIEAGPGGEPNPEDISRMMGVLLKWMGSLFLVSILSWLIMVSVETAFHKNTLHGIDHGFFPLRFGVPELRVMLAQFIVYLIVNVVYLVVYFAFILVILIAIGIGSAISPTVAAILGGIVGVAGFFGMLIVILLVLARLAPAAAMSVRDDEIRLLEGWKLTKNMYWPMIGSYFIIWLVGYVLILIIFLGFAMLAFGDTSVFDSFENIPSDDPEAFAIAVDQLFSNLRVTLPLIIGTIITSFITFVFYAATWGVANHAVALDTKKQENPFS